MKRIIATVCALIALISSAFAYEEFTGIVLNEKNEPLPGARVEIVDGTKSMSTDFDGRFRFSLSEPAKKVRVSYIGYNPVECEITPEMVVKLGGKGWANRSHGYRGFFDLTGGVGFGGREDLRFQIPGSEDVVLNDIGNIATFGFSMTHGYQINRHLFMGLGFGAYTTFRRYRSKGWDYVESYDIDSFNSLIFPVFYDVRWDFALQDKVSPFIDLKVGYQFVFERELYYFAGGHRYYYEGQRAISEYWDINCDYTHTSGLYLMPTLGIRTSLGGKAGLNLGLSYNIFVRNRINAWIEWRSGFWDSNNYHRIYPFYWVDTKSKSLVSSALMLLIGFDF